MAEYIERKLLIDKFDRMGLGEHSFVERVFSDGVRTIIAGIPDADVAPVVHGAWIDFYGEHKTAECSECQKLFEVTFDGPSEPEFFAAFQDSYRYCPNCGARMDGGACKQVCKYNTPDRGCVAGELGARCDLANVAGERGNGEAG